MTVSRLRHVLLLAAAAVAMLSSAAAATGDGSSSIVDPVATGSNRVSPDAVHRPPPSTATSHSMLINQLGPRGPSNGQPTASWRPATSAPAERCREGCLQKRSIKDILCAQQRECSMCWDVCNRHNQIRRENELAHRLLLSLVRLVRNESVVTAGLEWTTPAELVRHQPPATRADPGASGPSPAPLAATENVERLVRISRAETGAPSRVITTSAPPRRRATLPEPELQEYHQCLVSWEILGGGLTGNLLTETFKVELSLWPNTKYHVHVTCRNKETDALIRSASLLVDTSEALIVNGPAPTPEHPSTQRPTVGPPPGPWAPDGDDDGEVMAVAAPPFGGGPGPGTSQELLILGGFVALLLLVLLSLIGVMLAVAQKPVVAPDDGELLIESEVLPKILHV
ncbi:uncharacterized protein LOC128269643 [Anopheles cruzii]|uniref:uncharacterized protein LOC128269643 n=1 Tax=Anopheles cruzii TaxID=68878 RepID=UPI0022EC651A|nr:uncharacterized protein LOC128269643 [Anopheles cruzii]